MSETCNVCLVSKNYKTFPCCVFNICYKCAIRVVKCPQCSKEFNLTVTWRPRKINWVLISKWFDIIGSNALILSVLGGRIMRRVILHKGDDKSFYKENIKFRYEFVDIIWYLLSTLDGYIGNNYFGYNSQRINTLKFRTQILLINIIVNRFTRRYRWYSSWLVHYIIGIIVVDVYRSTRMYYSSQFDKFFPVDRSKDPYFTLSSCEKTEK